MRNSIAKSNAAILLIGLVSVSNVLVAINSRPCLGQSQNVVKQIPTMAALPDMTSRLQQQLDENDGKLLLTDEFYRITEPLEVDLAAYGVVAIKSLGGTTLIMDGPGPALRLKGSHQGTASPLSFMPSTWNERMPIVTGIEILGAHEEAVGIELQQTVGAVVNRVSVRWCRHGIHLTKRNRNVIISDCHLYENSGVGIFLDDVNLHQINVNNSHISYNRCGGVVVRDGNVRNLQVTGCDIEGNMPGDPSATKAANILIDVSGSEAESSKSIAEIAITGCTIQHSANYSRSEEITIAPGGANIRLAGKKIYPIDSVTITGNVISDTETNIDIRYAQDVAISSNTFFAPKPSNLVVEASQRIVVTGNTFNPRQFTRPGTIRFRDCADCILANSTLHKFSNEKGAVILEKCQGFTVTGLNLSDCRGGFVLRNCSDMLIANCRVTRGGPDQPDLSIDRSNSNVMLNGNAFSGTIAIERDALAEEE